MQILDDVPGTTARLCHCGEPAGGPAYPIDPARPGLGRIAVRHEACWRAYMLGGATPAQQLGNAR
jgi:hypothetical protein